MTLSLSLLLTTTPCWLMEQGISCNFAESMNRHKPNGIERAIQAAGSLRALAKRMQVARYTVAYWRDKGVPAHRVKAIVSAVNGAVTAHDLRPDLW